MSIGDLGDVIQRRFGRHRSSVVDQDYYPLQGGLNTEQEPMTVPPGELLGVKNFEPGIFGGYARLEGNERFDGQPAPSEADYWKLSYDTGLVSPAFAIDDLVTQAVTGATGVVALYYPDTPDTTGYVILRSVTGTFDATNILSVSAVNRASSSSLALINGESTDALDELANQAVQEKLRALIAKVPGSGPVRGVWIYKSIIYAVRNNSGGTAGVLHKATTSGWTAIDLGIKLSFRRGTFLIEEGTAISGASSSATATARRVVVKSGTFANGDAEGFIITDAVTGGPFTDNEDIQQPARVVSDTPATFQIGIRFKADSTTDPITTSEVVVGATSGATMTVDQITILRGSWAGGDAEGYLMTSGAITVASFQASEDLNISAVKHGATPSKAVQTVAFENGASEVFPGDELSGVTSSASMTLQLVKILTGSYVGSDAAGFLSTDTVTGGPFQASEDIQLDLVALSAKTALDSAQVAQTLPAGGLYRFHNHNFGGHTKTYRCYGVNGVGQAFEFDNQVTPNVFTLIESGMDTDTPTHLEEFNNHLFLAFPGGSLQHSGFQAPLVFNPILGADERNTGDEITNMYADRNKSMVITTRQLTFILYGSSRENFELRKHTEETGAIQNSLQRIGDVFFIDDRGITQLAATEQFGNFQGAALSSKIERRIKGQLQTNAVATSLISRRKNLIRWVLEDGQIIVLGINSNQAVGFTEIDYGRTFHCSCSEEFESGVLFKERIFMGGDDGYVYEMDKGTTNDGSEIEAFLRLAYHHSGRPDRTKRYLKATFDLDTSGDATFDATVDYNYGAKPGQASTELTVSGGVGYWDVSNLDEYDLGGSAFKRPAIRLFGSGFNIGFFFYTNEKYQNAWTINGISLQWSARRINRDTES